MNQGMNKEINKGMNKEINKGMNKEIKKEEKLYKKLFTTPVNR
jgi:hypothetical protein